MEERQLVSELSALLEPQRVLAGSAVKRAYDCDAYTVDRFPPICVVLPTSTEEVQEVFSPGYYTRVQVVFAPAAAEEVRDLSVGIEFNTVSLRTWPQSP